MQLNMSNDSLEEFIISQVYKNLRSVFSQSNANFLPIYPNIEHEIEL